MLRLFFWGGPGKAGYVVGVYEDLLPVEAALKKSGWKVILLSWSVEDSKPYPGYEKQYREWKDYEA